MSGFSTEWLDVREPVDHAARNKEVLSAVSHYFSNDQNLRITDIGCGTGSTLRALKPYLSQELSWHLIDNDDALLDWAKANLDRDQMVFSLADLSKSLDVLFENKPSLITTSAFLDLVSDEWLQRLCAEITDRNIPFYAALSYDGRAGCSPGLPDDENVLRAFNEHQKTDKGFGPALGPDAADTAISVFESAGYLVTSGRSDWNGDPKHPVFQKLLLEGWSSAACEIEEKNSALFEKWLAERKRFIDETVSSVYVGHIDFFAVPNK